MAQSKARYLSSLLTASGFVRDDRSQLAGSDGLLDSPSLPAISNAMLVHTGITINDYTVSLGDSQDLTTGDIAEHVNLYYTTARADSDAKNAISGGTGLTYNSTTGVIDITNTGVASGTYGSASQVPVFTVNAQGQIDSIGVVNVAGVDSFGYNNGTGEMSIATADGGNFTATITLNPFTSTDLVEGTNLYYTQNRVDSSFDARLATKTTDNVTEGTNNLYWTNARFDSSLAGASTTDLSEGENLYYTQVRFDSAFGDKTTDGLTEGSTNRYFTTARVRSSISASGDINYDSATGVISLTVENVYNKASFDSDFNVAMDSATTSDLAEGSNLYYTDTRARNAIGLQDQGGDGSLTYDSASGRFSYTGPSATEARAHFSAGTGLTFNSGEFSITNTGVAAGTYGSASLVPVVTINAQGQVDSIGTVSVAGVSSINFDSANGNFTINTADGGVYVETITLDPYTTTDLTEGTNLYYTQARFDTAFTGKSTTDLSEGNNLYYTTARADSDAKNAISVADSGGDGSLSYNAGTGTITYTGPSATEVRAHFSGGTGVTITNGVVAVGQSVGTTDDVTFGKVTADSAVLDGINFNVLTSRHSNAAGTLYFDSDHQKGLSLVLDTQNNPNPDVTLNIGQEIFLYVHNLTGAQIDNGDAVYISGTAHGKHPQVSLARANASATGQPSGLATMDIPDGAHGWVTRYGIVRDVNTGSFAAGSTLYLSADSAGKWTSTEVTVDTGYPFHIGQVLTSDSSVGTILVDGFSEHYEYLRIEDRLKVSGRLEADSASLLNVQFNTTLFDSHQPYSEGLLYYDNKHKTLNYNDDITGMVHEVGTQEHQRVFNNTGSLIRKGQPLYFSGNYTSGNLNVPTVDLADATDVNAYNAQGIAAQDIADNSYGHCLISGQLTNVNTSGLSDGSNFFVGLGPGLTQNSSPVYPNFPMCLGWVVQSGDSDTGILLVNQQNHSVNSFRVTSSAHIGTNLQVDGNLTVLGSQTTVGTSNVTQGAPFYRLNEGDAIGEANTVFTGTGLDDAFFAGHFTGTTAQTYYVRIDGVGTGPGGVDTFEVALSDDSAFASPVLTKEPITGEEQLIHSTDNISVDFGATTGHDSGDRWSGTAAPVNIDTGFFTNRNTGTSGVGYTHMGIFFDVTDEKWKLLDAYDSTPTGSINMADSSVSLATLVAGAFEGNLTGDLTGNADTATALANGRNFSITGDVIANVISFDGTGNVALSAAIAAGSIVNADINATANITDTKLATISTAGKVQNSATTATDANTGSTIVERDASGNFAAGTITAALTGNVTGNVTGDVTGDVTGTVSSIANHSTTDLSEGTNLYYTTSRADSDFDIRLAIKSTTNLSEGSNLYYTTARVNTDFDTRLATKSTTNLSEGTNLYYTTARADSDAKNAISVSGDLGYNAGTGVISFSETYSTATELLTAIKTVDGATSGLDADLLDGQHGSYYRINVYNSAGVLQN